ncbi:hypothetical protein J437_LFUL007972 [Ladona fulva]|uniref:BACK domain-containing protein n=1 Tax=Ladona fulva TaxID=123851 RepID=A0A8K0K5Q1_LADFU|nr:hypothetical protein J437_LFUL007972 [Ladona fulva]
MVLEFVDEHGNEVLNLGSFTLLPQHVVRLILAREELRADEFTKFQAALMWGKKYCDSNPNTELKEVIGNFLEYIQFHKIPANVLMRDVHPLSLVPYHIIMNALAYQVRPRHMFSAHIFTIRNIFVLKSAYELKFRNPQFYYSVVIT